jgi:hypothetical protein
MDVPGADMDCIDGIKRGKLGGGTIGALNGR